MSKEREIRFYLDKEMDKNLTLKLAGCDYIANHLNVIVVGATGQAKHIIFLH